MVWMITSWKQVFVSKVSFWGIERVFWMKFLCPEFFSGKLLMKDCYCYLWYSVISGDDGEVWGWGEEGGWWWTGGQESIKAGLQTFWHRRLYPFQKDVDFILSAFMMEFFWFSLRDACAHWSRNSPPYCSRSCCLSAQSGRAGQGKSQIWLITL